MVEVFKTNVKDKKEAQQILKKIRNSFKEYEANFDLDDCDRILRIECRNGDVGITELVQLLNKADVRAEVLPDLD